MGNATVSSSCGSWRSEQWGWELLLPICNSFGLCLEKKVKEVNGWGERKQLCLPESPAETLNNL